MKRLLLFLIFAAGLLLGAGRAGELYPLRRIEGRLSFDAATLPAQSQRAGNFLIRWEPDPGQVIVTPASVSDKWLWASVPGQAFLTAGRGVETVTEGRGYFAFEDTLMQVCTRQSLSTVEAEGETVVLRGTLACDDGSAPGYRLTFTPESDNRLGFDITLDDARLNRLYLTFAAGEDERFFGFGEQFTFVDMRGRRLPIFVQEQGIGRGAQPITAGANLTAGAGGTWHHSYAGMPYTITSAMRGLFLENSEYAVFDMRAGDRVQIQLWSAGMQGKILQGDDPPELLRAFTEYAGRMPPLPDWLLGGAVIGMQGGTARVRDVWSDLQRHNTPIAAFWLQDWVGQRTTSFGKQLWWNWEVDRSHYAGWDDLVTDLNAAGAQVLVYVNPYLVDVSEKGNARRNLFREAAALGYLVTAPDGEPYLIQNTDFSAGLVDLTNPAAVVWLQDVIRTEVIGAGAAGWMADFGEALPYDAVLASGAPAGAYHNRYPVDWAALNRAVAAPDAGLVFFTRAGYTQSPGHSTLFWLGDQLVSWDADDGIKTAVTGLLSGGLSGISLNHSDIGGYTTITNPLRDYHRSRELLWRWMELNAFTTVFRTHEGNQPENNHQFYSDEETLAFFSRMARVYAAWEPYRRRLVAEAAETGLPVVRHPFVHYPDETRFYDLRYEQFMVGADFMVAPVLDPDTEVVTPYLPPGRWVHVWSGVVYGDPAQGSEVRITAPLGEPAVFYREGSPAGEQFRADLAAAGLLTPP